MFSFTSLVVVLKLFGFQVTHLNRNMSLSWIFTLCLVFNCISLIKPHMFDNTANRVSVGNVLKIEDIEQDGWQMVFRGTSGNGHSVYHAWTEGKHSNPDKPVSMKRTYGLHYRDNMINNWSNLGIKLVKFAFYNTDREVAYVVFNGKDSNINNWFDEGRIIDSSWPDLTPKSVYNVFGIVGAGSPKRYNRRFYISRNHNGCPGDRGHLVIIDSIVESPVCLYDNQPSYPTFIYSKFNSVDYFERRMFGIADFMVVLIKT